MLLPIGAIAIALAIIFLPPYLRHNHKNIVVSSVALYLDNNYVLGEQSLGAEDVSLKTCPARLTRPTSKSVVAGYKVKSKGGLRVPGTLSAEELI